ncbi:putative shikimate kinase [Mycobacterium xenopi 4042]|uniref:Putative shikimate kinase n=1 Tax=Mycobacterium xenopi 4042 TaxID=1299334 RepID=X8DEJ1_MYCXE|nr:putative shikimate kinase [Mycobacterium xenopi 4042]
MRGAAAGVVVEAMVALVLARAALEKFGGDSLPRPGQCRAYLRSVAQREPVSDPPERPGMAPGRCWSGARLGKSTIAPAGQGARGGDARHRRRDRAAHGRKVADIFAATVKKSSAASKSRWCARRWPSTTASSRWAAVR